MFLAGGLKHTKDGSSVNATWMTLSSSHGNHLREILIRQLFWLNQEFCICIKWSHKSEMAHKDLFLSKGLLSVGTHYFSHAALISCSKHSSKWFVKECVNFCWTNWRCSSASWRTANNRSTVNAECCCLVTKVNKNHLVVSASLTEKYKTLPLLKNMPWSRNNSSLAWGVVRRLALWLK